MSVEINNIKKLEVITISHYKKYNAYHEILQRLICINHRWLRLLGIMIPRIKYFKHE